MCIATSSPVSRTLTLVLLAFMGNLAAVRPGAADVNVGPLTCAPTVASAANALAWHEHYLINPPTATANRYVVCNIPFDSMTLPNTFSVGAFGLNNEGAATLVSTCWVNVVDLRNQHAPTTFSGQPFLSNPGQSLSYTKLMNTRSKAGYLWSAWAQLTVSAVADEMSEPIWTPIDPLSTFGPAYWTITVKCQLKPGQALTMVKVFPTAWP